MRFNAYLKNKMINKSSKSTIAELNLFHPIFKDLDEVTFSRWINNRVTPSNKKIALIVLFFKDDYIKTLSILKLKSLSKSFQKKISVKEKKLSDPYFSFYDKCNAYEFNNLIDFKKKSPHKNNIETIIDPFQNSIEKIIFFDGCQSYVYSFYLDIKKDTYWPMGSSVLPKGQYIITPPTYQTHMETHNEILYCILSYICENLADVLMDVRILHTARTNAFSEYYSLLGYQEPTISNINNTSYYIYETLLIDHITSERMINLTKYY
ncbi:hypothetical protein NRD16_001061 [Photobacterium damselae]|nr:hypothetical protein [Photobacterium damselae]